MPIYEFKCEGCGKRIECILGMGERNLPQVCPGCVHSMSRIVELPGSAIIPETGREKVLANLNSKDDGHGNYPHHKAAMWGGLNQTSPVVGRGLG